MNDKQHGVFWLGILILSIFCALTAVVLFASYHVLVGGLKIQDPGVIAVIFTMIGTIIGSVSALAQQVTNYFYGSSKGSADKSAGMMAAAMANQKGEPADGSGDTK